uniref:Serpentine receptor class gamma n=1 Tax=Globodera pallida TaxID=36090 RepID=A0A183BKS8_GLOPA
MWCCETVMEMTLAFNRCVELSSARWTRLLFHGKRIYLWMLFPTFYGLYFFWFTQTLTYSGIFFSWFFNPHIGYIDDFDKTYHNDFHTYHNYIVITVLTGTYAAFGFILYMKSRQVHISSTSVSSHEQSSKRAQNLIFFQVILISLINAVAASIYVYMQFVRISEFLIVIGQLTWVLAHGIPPIIYLVFNKTVRRDVYSMMMKPLSKIFYCCIKAPADQSTRLFNTTVRRTPKQLHSANYCVGKNRLAKFLFRFLMLLAKLPERLRRQRLHPLPPRAARSLRRPHEATEGHQQCLMID